MSVRSVGRRRGRRDVMARARRIAGSILVIGGLVATVILAALSSGSHPPSTQAAALFALAIGASQVGSAFVFDGAGKADPTLARTAVRRLIRLGDRTRAARQRAENAFEIGKASDLKVALGHLSVDLSWIEEGVVEEIDTWAEFHPDVVSKLLEADDLSD